MVLQDPETYIHRSGRTGRAGSTGLSVTLVDRKKEGLIPYIQKKAGVVFERIGAPQPAQMAQIAGALAVHLSEVKVCTVQMLCGHGPCFHSRVVPAAICPLGQVCAFGPCL